MKPSLIPPHIARLMDPKDRQRYVAGEAVGSEAVEQSKFGKWLKDQWEKGRLEYFWTRTDKRSTNKPGQPDFIIAYYPAKTLWIEFKAPEGEPSPVQRATLENLLRLEHSTFIARSGAQAIRFVELLLYKQAQL